MPEPVPESHQQTPVALDGQTGGLLRRLRFGQKLALAFGGLLALAAILAVVGVRGIVTVKTEYGQALNFGAAFAQRSAEARAEILGARRCEKEFLLRLRTLGVLRAAEAYLQRPAALQQHLYPIDAVGTVQGHIAEARARLDELAHLLHDERPTLKSDEAGAKMGQDVERLAVTARSLRAHIDQFEAQLAELSKRFARRGDADAPSPLADDATPARQKWLQTDSGRVATTAAPFVQLCALPQQSEMCARIAAAQRAQNNYLAGTDFGRPLPAEASDTGNDGAQEALNRWCASDTAQILPETTQAGQDWLDAVARLAGAAMLPASLPLSPYRSAALTLVGTDRELHRELRRFQCNAAQMERELDEFAELGPKAMGAFTDLAQQAALGAAATVDTVAILALLLGIALAFGLARNIRVPVKELANTAHQLAAGNLAARAWVYSHDEIGELAADFNNMADKLQDQSTKLAAQMQALQVEQDRSERLLLNVLPSPIAARLKERQHPIADHFDQCSVLFADVVGYTALSARMDPTAVVAQLGRIFSAFDEIAQRLGIEKIKTIGDAYMAACGLPLWVPDHQQRLADMALEMLAAMETLNRAMPEPMLLRIGLNCGPVVAGVIGDRKFIYDLWGDAVNVASRMESHGIPGAIQLPATMAEALQATHILQYRGIIEVKGRGAMETYLLTGRRETTVQEVH